MDDTISRQAAIEDIREYKAEPNHCCDESEIKGYNDGLDTAISALAALPSAQPEQAIKDCRNCKYGSYNDHLNNYFCYYSGDCNDWNKWEPSVQPDNKLAKIIDLVEGTIDHFDRDDAMDLLYQIKETLR